MVRQRINCNAPLFSPADYDFIMQRENERPRKKVLEELMHKYNTSMKRIYQIWRGIEANRIASNWPIADISNAESGPGVLIETTPSVSSYAGGLERDHPPAISSPPALLLKKNSRKKKTGKTSVSYTETELEMPSQHSANTTNNTDIISKMGSELEEVLKQIDDIK
ncbi:16029_t:CDS:1 [Cetraspora pellucida]|uniref:16029_t:CDS:1 n=1 Tax=Cetraspora pellucida TaxID=1433469 RepID=A0A9N9B3X3_9GLOM|nr:16029_t:CDS:1 [Cetraspora pellucida]